VCHAELACTEDIPAHASSSPTNQHPRSEETRWHHVCIVKTPLARPTLARPPRSPTSTVFMHDSSGNRRARDWKDWKDTRTALTKASRTCAQLCSIRSPNANHFGHRRQLTSGLIRHCGGSVVLIHSRKRSQLATVLPVCALLLRCVDGFRVSGDG
jgi:hypothetical protein